MSVVDDVRKLIQDLVTPELRAQGVRLDHIEKRLESLERDLRTQGDSLRNEIHTGIARIAEILQIEQRLSAVENRLEDRERKQLPEKKQ